MSALNIVHLHIHTAELQESHAQGEAAKYCFIRGKEPITGNSREGTVFICNPGDGFSAAHCAH